MTGICGNCKRRVSIVDLEPFKISGKELQICPMCRKWVFNIERKDEGEKIPTRGDR